MAFPVIPFASLPRKSWTQNAEKKNRLEITDLPSIESSSSSDGQSVGSSSSSEYDLIEHLRDLLPGDVENGDLPKKRANEAHLEDLRIRRRPPDRLKYFKMAYEYVKQWRANERERRKHHMLREYEERVKKYETLLQEKAKADLASRDREAKLEAYRRLKRIERNSRKKIEKNKLAEQFSRDLSKRELEDKRMRFYCENFPSWAHENMDRDENQRDERKREKEIQDNERERDKLHKIKKKLIEDDRALIDYDHQLSNKIDEMMLRRGIIAYEKKSIITEEEGIENVFRDNAKKLEKKRKEKVANGTSFIARKNHMTMQDRTLDELSPWNENDHEDDDEEKEELLDFPSSFSLSSSLTQNSNQWDIETNDNNMNNSSNQRLLVLQLDESQSASFPTLENVLRKDKHRRGKSKSYFNPFKNKEQFKDTNDVTKVKGIALKELGAMVFATELSSGLCPLLEEISLKDCQIRDVGLGRVLFGVRSANLYTLRVLDLRGNFLSATAVNNLVEISKSGVLGNLQILNLTNNELRDDGVSAIVNLLFTNTLISLKELHLQRNAITDTGFHQIVCVLLATCEKYCPKLHWLGLENNLISSFSKQELAPLPYYLSV